MSKYTTKNFKKAFEAEEEILSWPYIGFRRYKDISAELGDGDPLVAYYRIQENPYELLNVSNVGFLTTDSIARQVFGVKQDDPIRHTAGNHHIMKHHRVLTVPRYVKERADLDLKAPEHIENGPILYDELTDSYWLNSEHNSELGLLDFIKYHLNEHAADHREDIELSPTQLKICQDYNLDEQQINAVITALSNEATCLTGGAGTGKTTVICAIVECLIADKKSAIGLAFAGKAADRMREMFEHQRIFSEASTIHAALRYNGKRFELDEIDQDFIIIDECSMIPNHLFHEVISRGRYKRFLFVGDPNQLPPIGYGTPFEDFISQGIKHVHLAKNYRQREQQGILRVAEGILSKSKPAEDDSVQFFLDRSEQALETAVIDSVEKFKDLNFEQWQAISYLNESVATFNNLLQGVFNSSGKFVFQYRKKLKRSNKVITLSVKEGDKVVVVENKNTYGIYNGQTGILVEGIRERGKVVGVLLQILGGKLIEIPIRDAEKHLELGYVITVHKSQGSDWDHVLFIQPSAVRSDTAKRLFYTAVTRAKHSLSIFSQLSSRSWWTNATTEAAKRESSLVKRLKARADV